MNIIMDISSNSLNMGTNTCEEHYQRYFVKYNEFCHVNNKVSDYGRFMIATIFSAI